MWPLISSSRAIDMPRLEILDLDVKSQCDGSGTARQTASICEDVEMYSLVKDLFTVFLGDVKKVYTRK